MKIWVVLGEEGEYSDRSVWVSAVYDNREDAERAITERSAVRGVWEQWSLARPRWSQPNYAALLKAYKAQNPEPECEPAERFELNELEVGVWEKPKHD